MNSIALIVFYPMACVLPTLIGYCVSRSHGASASDAEQRQPVEDHANGQGGHEHR